MKPREKILVVRASGGLANRLLALLNGIAYALLTQRILCVDWRDGLYSDDFSNVFPLWFHIDTLQTCTCEQLFEFYRQGASVVPTFWQQWLPDAVAVEYLFKGNEHMSAYNRALSSVDMNELHISEDIAVFWHWSAAPLAQLSPLLQQNIPALAHVTDTNMAPALLNTYVRPAAHLLQEKDAFLKCHFSNAPIGIHIRHSDLQSPLHRMLEKLQEIAKKDDEIFLCTDNEYVETMVRRLFPHVVTQKKTYQGTGVPLHSYVPGISNVQKGHEAILDMLLLAQCKAIIHYAPSSFATIPIFWSGLAKECIHSVGDVK